MRNKLGIICFFYFSSCALFAQEELFLENPPEKFYSELVFFKEDSLTELIENVINKKENIRRKKDYWFVEILGEKNDTKYVLLSSKKVLLSTTPDEHFENIMYVTVIGQSITLIYFNKGQTIDLIHTGMNLELTKYDTLSFYNSPIWILQKKEGNNYKIYWNTVPNSKYNRKKLQDSINKHYQDSLKVRGNR